MRVSQLLHVMDKDDDIIVHDYYKPIDQCLLYRGTVREICKDSPINRMHVLNVCADDDTICVLTMKETELNTCEKCAFYDEDRDDQPCCTCCGQNFEEADNEKRAD